MPERNITKNQSITTANQFFSATNLTTPTTFLGIDYGQRYTGLALGHWPNLLVVPLVTLESRHISHLSSQIMNIFKTRGINYMILGMPTNKNGEISTVNPDIIALYHELNTASQNSIYVWDERYTSQWANRLLQDYRTAARSHLSHHQKNTRGCKIHKKDKLYVNQLAAVNILQTFLDFLEHKTS